MRQADINTLTHLLSTDIEPECNICVIVLVIISFESEANTKWRSQHEIKTCSIKAN